MTEVVDTIRGILTDTSNRMQHIRSIQFLAWNTPDEIPEKYAEVVQELSAIAGRDVTLSFTPLLAPMPRGILATTTMRTGQGVTLEDVREAFDVYYASSPFVQFLPDGRWPTTAATAGTNCGHLQAAVDERSGRVVVVAAIDNLGKGAAGQAVQNANLMCGFPETTGLDLLGVTP